APWLETESVKATSAGTEVSDSITRRGLQMLWLRALHHCGLLDRALTWARTCDAAHRLDAHAAGVASLIALDASEFDLAERWSQASLALRAEPGPPTETLVTQASLALAAQDAARARQYAQAALVLQPSDGRAWSAHGFATLLAGDLPAARESFERSVRAMPGHIGTWHGLGWTQILQGDLAAARETFDKALALDRNFAESHGGLAVVLAMTNQKADALLSADRALGLDKSNLSGRYAQALVNGEVQDAQSVRRLAQRLSRGRAAPLGGDMADLFEHPRPGRAGGSDS
ncbi:MAG: hypothetical protein KKC85_00900, partial [Gammaproteobacteria bacterium]|nr:hypothetical protein [Gammaproteobacteria bacterium]